MRSLTEVGTRSYAEVVDGADARATAFLDRDGTINIDTGYVHDPDHVELEKGVVDGLRKLSALGFRLIVVSNQSGVARALMSHSDVDAVNARLDGMLRERGVEVAAWFYCPHLPDEGCACRKPRPGLIDEADAVLPSLRSLSVMIGDKPSDVELAEAAHLGLGGILLGGGSATNRVGLSVAADLSDVAERLARNSGRVT